MRFGKILTILFALLLITVSISAQENIISYTQIAEYEVGIVRDMMLLADGTYVVASDSGLWTLNPNEAELQQWETPAAVSSLFFFNGNEIGLIYEDNSLGIWDAANGIELSHYSGHSDAINAVIVLGSGQHLLSGSDDGSLRLWNVATASEEAVLFEGEAAVTQIIYNQYTYLVAALTGDNSVHIWSYSSRLDLGVLSSDEDVTSIGFNPHPTSPDLLVGTADGKIHVWPIGTQVSFEYEGVVYLVYEVPLESGTQNLALVTPGRRESSFIDPNNPAGGLITWTGSWRSLNPALPSIEELSESLVLDTDSAAVQALPAHFRLVVSIGEDKIVRGWLDDYTEFYQLDLSAYSAIILMNQRIHEFFATVHEDNSVSFWSAEFGWEFAQLPAQTAKTTHIAGSIVNLSNFATATEDGMLHLWQIVQ